jgi:protein involved in polysaccharide export with SLBB domain
MALQCPNETETGGKMQKLIRAIHGRDRTVAAALVIGWALIQPAASSGSVGQSRSFEYDLLFPSSSVGQVPVTTVVGPEIAPPLESPIDPASYLVVPGDLLQLEVGGETDRAWRMAVSAEGKLLLPGVESIDVAGRTLAQTEVAVREKLSARFPGKPIFLHLLQPGMFRIYVTGSVATPGVQAVHGYDRAAFCIGAAGGPLPGGSLRHVSVAYPDGTEREIDLVRFALLGELDQNLQVVPGIRIHLPAARDFVHVTGAVRGLPGLDRPIIPNVGSRIPESPRAMLEWKEGDTIGLAITRVGGLSEDATGMILLLRENERRILALSEADPMPLRPGDLIEAAVRNRWVYVTGAVRYPGPYAHLPSLSASDYVRLAGGPTELGRGHGWKILPADGGASRPVGKETYVEPGSTVNVSERWTYRVSTLLAPISGITALVISLVALRR